MPSRMQHMAGTGAGDVDMHLSELLGAMYNQTCQMIDVGMEDYDE